VLASNLDNNKKKATTFCLPIQKRFGALDSSHNSPEGNLRDVSKVLGIKKTLPFIYKHHECWAIRTNASSI